MSTFRNHGPKVLCTLMILNISVVDYVLCWQQKVFCCQDRVSRHEQGYGATIFKGGSASVADRDSTPRQPDTSADDIPASASLPPRLHCHHIHSRLQQHPEPPGGGGGKPSDSHLRVRIRLLAYSNLIIFSSLKALDVL